MKKFSVITAVIVITVMLFTLLIPAGKAQSDNSQEYRMSRFVIVSAPINVQSPRQGGSYEPRYVMVKMDTVTGRSWILQLDVAGGNDPKVRSSSWKELGLHRQ